MPFPGPPPPLGVPPALPLQNGIVPKVKGPVTPLGAPSRNPGLSAQTRIRDLARRRMMLRTRVRPNLLEPLPSPLGFKGFPSGEGAPMDQATAGHVGSSGDFGAE